jgi:hypothetical protein
MAGETKFRETMSNEVMRNIRNFHDDEDDGLK